MPTDAIFAATLSQRSRQHIDNNYPALKIFTVDLLMRLDGIKVVFPQLITAHSIQVTVGG